MPMTVENAHELLKSAHERGRLAHALILSGPAGSGKTDLAARLIQSINKPKDEAVSYTHLTLPTICSV